MEELTEEERRVMDRAKERKKQALDTSTDSTASSSTPSKPPPAAATAAAAAAARKPWQRGVVGGVARARKPGASSSVSVPSRAPIEHGLRIGWDGREEEWLAEEAALAAAHIAEKVELKDNAAAASLDSQANSSA
jgi:hypothetical protein